jgi:class 3 adenylate cyclase
MNRACDPDAPARASKLALEMRDAVAKLGETLRKRGHQPGCGISMAQGYASLGRIGFEDRCDLLKGMARPMGVSCLKTLKT